VKNGYSEAGEEQPFSHGGNFLDQENIIKIPLVRDE
jgi:hypothetical protein